MTITNTTCHTFTHHTDRGIAVECVAHGLLVEIPQQPKGEPTSREIAKATQAEHEEEHR